MQIHVQHLYGTDFNQTHIQFIEFCCVRVLTENKHRLKICMAKIRPPLWFSELTRLTTIAEVPHSIPGCVLDILYDYRFHPSCDDN